MTFTLIDGPSIPVPTSPKTPRIRDPPSRLRTPPIASLWSSSPQSLDSPFRRYHEVLGRARWASKAVARRLLLHLLDQLLPDGPVVIGIDDTIERRWGARIKARGIYRDPVRSSKGHFVKTSGLRWLSLMVVVP